MNRTASDILRHLEARIARLERGGKTASQMDYVRAIKAIEKVAEKAGIPMELQSIERALTDFIWKQFEDTLHFEDADDVEPTVYNITVTDVSSLPSSKHNKGVEFELNVEYNGRSAKARATMFLGVGRRHMVVRDPHH